MTQFLFTLLGVSLNMFIMAFLAYAASGIKARKGIDDLVREALLYVK